MSSTKSVSFALIISVAGGILSSLILELFNVDISTYSLDLNIAVLREFPLMSKHSFALSGLFFLYILFVQEVNPEDRVFHLLIMAMAAAPISYIFWFIISLTKITNQYIQVYFGTYFSMILFALLIQVDEQ